MNRLRTFVFNGRRQVRETGWFRNALYLFLLYKTLVYLCRFHTLFSAEGMVYTRQAFPGGVDNLPFVLNNHYSKGFALACIGWVALASLAGLARRAGYLVQALLWLAVINLNNYLYASLTAGDYLLNQLLFFNIFFCSKAIVAGSWGEVQTALHNVALAGAKIQVCLAYFLAAWFKLTDVSWLGGSAVYDAFQVPEYSNVLLAAIPGSLCMVLTYATMIYQGLFPFAIWFRPFKIYLLAFGVIQHLIIAFGMGLFSFGITMLICYLLFLTSDSRPIPQPGSA